MVGWTRAWGTLASCALGVGAAALGAIPNHSAGTGPEIWALQARPSLLRPASSGQLDTPELFHGASQGCDQADLVPILRKQTKRTELVTWLHLVKQAKKQWQTIAREELSGGLLTARPRRSLRRLHLRQVPMPGFAAQKIINCLMRYYCCVIMTGMGHRRPNDRVVAPAAFPGHWFQSNTETISQP